MNFPTVFLKVRFHSAGQIMELSSWQAICQVHHPHRPLIPLPHSLEDPPTRSLKGVKKDSIYLFDKVERVLPFAQKCMHSIPCLQKRQINFQRHLSEFPLFNPRGNFNQIQTPITNYSNYFMKKILLQMQFRFSVVSFSKRRDTYRIGLFLVSSLSDWIYELLCLTILPKK